MFGLRNPPLLTPVGHSIPPAAAGLIANCFNPNRLYVPEGAVKVTSPDAPAVAAGWPVGWGTYQYTTFWGC